MIAPAEAFRRLLAAVAMGLGLGFVYGFLRPLRRGRCFFADLVFLCCALAAWLQVGFGICGGDLRLGYLAGLPLGAILWECTAGRLLRPAISRFWKILGAILGFPLGLSKKILKKKQKNCKKHLFNREEMEYNKMALS